MLKLIGKYAKPFRIPSILSAITVVIEVILEIQIPLMMSQIIDTGVAFDDLSVIYRQGGLMIIFAVASLIFGVLSGYFAAKAGIGFGAGVRKGLFDKIQSYSFTNIDNFSTSSLITGRNFSYLHSYFSSSFRFLNG